MNARPAKTERPARAGIAHAAVDPSRRVFGIGSRDDAGEHEADQLAARALAIGTLGSAQPGAAGHGSGGAPIAHAVAPQAAGLDQILRDPGAPLAPTILRDLGARFGHDFSAVRTHADARAARSARALHARAYAIGQHLVFGAGEYAPGNADGRRLLAHELAHVVQAPDMPLIRRDVVNDAAGNPQAFEFRVGTELTLAFVQLAQDRAQNGVISDRDLRLLRTQALNQRGTVNDHERMFMAALLDPANVRQLQRLNVGPSARISFGFTSITTARMRHVNDLDRETLPASVADPLREGQRAMHEFRVGDALAKASEADRAAQAEILARAGAFQAQATALISYAARNGVASSQVLQAMLAAASDNSAGDRVLAGVAYAIADAASNPMAGDLLSGAIKVDALLPRAFARLPTGGVTTVAFYATAAQGSGIKGDTMYLQTSIDIDNLADRSFVIHELRHAQDDKAASPTARPSFPIKEQLELSAYRAQARYLLEQMATQPAAQQATSAAQAATTGGLALAALVLEAQTDRARFAPLLERVFGAAPAPLTRSPAQVARMLALPSARIEAALLQDIETGYGIGPTTTGVVEGLAGESLIDWLFRL